MPAGLRSFLLIGVGLVLVASLVLILGWTRYTLPRVPSWKE